LEIIGSRATVKALLAGPFLIYKESGGDSFVKSFQKEILSKKIRYPLLEFSGIEIYKLVPENEQINILDDIMALPESGRYVIAGIILQKRLSKHFEESLLKAGEYIISGNDWLACDTIGERVMGYSLLTDPEQTVPALNLLNQSENKWLVRSVGVATHYAVKKGLKKVFVEQMFQMLLSCAHTTDFHTKKGIGWGAKTISKFHPEIVSKYNEQIENDPGIRQWFKTKIRIGLGRSYKYASRYSG